MESACPKTRIISPKQTELYKTILKYIKCSFYVLFDLFCYFYVIDFLLFTLSLLGFVFIANCLPVFYLFEREKERSSNLVCCNMGSVGEELAEKKN